MCRDIILHLAAKVRSFATQDNSKWIDIISAAVSAGFKAFASSDSE